LRQKKSGRLREGGVSVNARLFQSDCKGGGCKRTIQLSYNRRHRHGIYSGPILNESLQRRSRGGRSPRSWTLLGWKFNIDPQELEELLSPPTTNGPTNEVQLPRGKAARVPELRILKIPVVALVIIIRSPPRKTGAQTAGISGSSQVARPLTTSILYNETATAGGSDSSASK
jgi:hypothetical protein